MKYIAFLRGINIGGHNVKMEDLRTHLTDLGLQNVRTYIQTGNVFFESDKQDRLKLEIQIAEHLKNKLGYAVPTFITTQQDLQKALLPDPFVGVDASPNIRLCVIFTCPNLPAATKIPHQIKTPGLELTVVKVVENAVLVISSQLNNRPGNPGMLLEKEFGVLTTTRFYHTALKLLDASDVS